MGSCSSVHRNSLSSKTVDKLVIPPSPIKNNPKNENFLVDDVVLLQSSRSTTTFNELSELGFLSDAASKEEAFFDSKAWIDSDCEDDFYSVNGEFTPSRGNTPLHHTFGTPSIKKASSEHIIQSTVPEPSPRTKKKNLLELFRESVREVQNDVIGNTSTNEQKEDKPIMHESAQNTPYISGGNSACSSDRTMNDDHDASTIREKAVEPVHCCLPSLASCRSFSERRRKTSAAIAANGKA